MMYGFNFAYVWFLIEYAHQMAVNIHPMKSTGNVYEVLHFRLRGLAVFKENGEFGQTVKS